MYVVNRKYTIKPERLNEFSTALKSTWDAVQRRKDCWHLSIRMYTEKSIVLTYEIWESDDAFLKDDTRKTICTQFDAAVGDMLANAVDETAMFMPRLFFLHIHDS